MKKLNLNEAPKTVAFAFGRFNPPTIGHEKLLDKVKSVRADDYLIFVSHSQNPKGDPLPYVKKVAWMKKSFPKHKNFIVTTKSRNIFEILVDIQKQYNPIGAPLESLIMVAGSDRVAEFKKLINEYNGVKARHGFYEFKNIEVISAGERDPDAEGVAGMSASKMRAAAEDSDFDSFKLGTPLKDTDAKKLYFDVRKSMGIKEQLDLTDFEVIRDLYLAEQIWNVGELIKVKGNNDSSYPTWEIIRRGTNYVTIIDESYNIRKIWLHDIEIDDVASRLDKSRIYPKVDESWFDDVVNKIKSKTIRKSNYEYAKEILQSVIDRKKRDKTLKHNKLYYAQRIGDQIPGVDYRMLATMVKEEVSDDLVDKIEKAVDKDLDKLEKQFKEGGTGSGPQGDDRGQYNTDGHVVTKVVTDKKPSRVRKLLKGTKDKLNDIKKKLSKEGGETKEMFKTFKQSMKAKLNPDKYGKPSPEDVKKANDQFKDVLKGVGMGTLSVLPVPGTALLIPTIVKVVKKKTGINLLPSSFDVKEESELIEESVKYGIPYSILKKIYYNEELSESEINVAREEIKEYWLIGTPEYDEYLKNLTPGENDKDEDRLNNRTKKLRLKDES